MNRPLRVAAVGAGYFSQFHYNAWSRLCDQGLAEMAGVCNLTREPAEALAGRFANTSVHVDFGDMLDHTKPDLVDIITPPPTHAAFVRAALNRDVAAICQKPFTPSLTEAEHLVADIGARGGRVFVHENFRFQPWYPKLKALVADGAVGDPYQVSFRLRPGDGQGEHAYLARQPYFQQMPRFLVHETAIHLIDTFRFLFGEVTSVFAQLDRLNAAINGEDAGIIVFNFANGRRALFDGNRLADHAADNRRLTMGELCLEGSAGTLTLDGYGVIRHRPFGDNQSTEVEYDWQDNDFGGDCVYRVIRHVVEHLRDGTPVMNDAASYLANVRIEDAVYRSAGQGAKIRIEPGPKTADEARR